MSISSASSIWSSATSALTNLPSSKSTHETKPNEAGRPAQSPATAQASPANPFQQLSSSLQSHLIQLQQAL